MLFNILHNWCSSLEIFFENHFALILKPPRIWLITSCHEIWSTWNNVCVCNMKENILLNGLWTEVLLHFFFITYFCHQQCTEMDEYLENRITLHWKCLKILKCICFWLLSQAGNMFHSSTIKKLHFIGFWLVYTV